MQHEKFFGVIIVSFFRFLESPHEVFQFIQHEIIGYLKMNLGFHEMISTSVEKLLQQNDQIMKLKLLETLPLNT